MNKAQLVAGRKSMSNRVSGLIPLVALVQPAKRFSGVHPIHIYGLRLVYVLMFFVLGKQTWTHVLNHRGTWEPNDAVAWCIWTAFAILAGFGILRPLPMLPILLLEVFYKVLWLLLVAYPPWSRGMLAESPAAPMASAFAWVLLPIAAIPWGYAFTHYVYDRKQSCPFAAFKTKSHSGEELCKVER